MPERPERAPGATAGATAGAGSLGPAGGDVGFAFRQCHPDHADVAETVRASAAYPSRFTPPGGRFGVRYVALAPETATAEFRRRAEQLGVPVAVAREAGGAPAVGGADNLAVFADVLRPGSDVRGVRSELLPLDDDTAESL